MKTIIGMCKQCRRMIKDIKYVGSNKKKPFIRPFDNKDLPEHKNNDNEVCYKGDKNDKK